MPWPTRIAGVRAGATHVQGCVNGYGERTGNADLSAAIPNLSLKLNVRTIPPDRLERITPVSHHIAELVNIAPDPQQPYVGSAAFAHKAGLHTSAIARRRDAYEHVPPDSVGNGTRFVVSEMAGRSTLALKAQELGLELDSDALSRCARHPEGARVPRVPLRGGRRLARAPAAPGDGVGARRSSRSSRSGSSPTDDDRDDVRRRVIDTTAHSGPPHDRGDGAGSGSATSGWSPPPRATAPSTPSTRPCARPSVAHFPTLSAVHLVDYRVRVLDTGKGTGAVTRVLIDTSDGEHVWTTIGVSENIIEASWQALFDSIVYGLVHAEAGDPRRPLVRRIRPPTTE